MRVGGPIAGVPVERIAEQVRTTANAPYMSVSLPPLIRTLEGVAVRVGGWGGGRVARGH